MAFGEPLYGVDGPGKNKLRTGKWGHFGWVLEGVTELTNMVLN